MMKKLLVGAAAVAVGDFAGGQLPPNLDFGGLPIRKYGVAVAGAYAGGMLAGHKPKLMQAVITGLAAMASAEVVSSVLKVSVPIAGFDVARIGAGAAGGLVGHKFGGE